MTFQEAIKIVYEKDGLKDQQQIGRAIGTLYFYRDNILELDDNEVTELYLALAHLVNNKVEVI